MKVKSIKNIKNLRGKKVLLRCDFNVPLKGKKVQDDFKIIKSLPTIRFLTGKGAMVVLITHLGRPKGKRSASCDLSAVNKRLEKLLGKKIKQVKDSVGGKAREAVEKMKNGEVIMLENLRFNKGEESDDKKFAKKLASLADIYVNDAFSVSHRAHASVSAVKKYLPSYGGLLLEKEVENLSKGLKPKKPMVLVMGGAKIKTKIPVIKNLSKKAEAVFIGGMITYDFLATLNLSTGRYKVDKKDKDLARKLLSKKIILPVDLLVCSNKSGNGKATAMPADEIPKGGYQLDIGPETIRFYARHLKHAKTIIWNGPLGMFENEKFKNGTLSLARVIASTSSGKAFGIAGGGETVEALKKTKMLEHVDWVSTGGGAMLSFLAGEKMPGLKGIIK